MSQENVEIVRRLHAANRSGPPEDTLEVGLSLCHPAVELRSRITAVEGADYRGHDGLRRYNADLADVFQSWVNVPSEIVEVGEDAVVVATTFRGVAHSGVEIELESEIVFVIRDAQVTRCLSYPTREEALKAAGLSE